MNTFRNLALFTALLLSWNIFANETVSIGNVEMANEKKAMHSNKLEKKLVNGKEQWFKELMVMLLMFPTNSP